MLIIVEGMDNSGKTTLVQRLSEDIKLLVMNNKRKPRDEAEMRDYLRLVNHVQWHFPTILDRLCTISEPIYGCLRKSGPVITPARADWHLLELKAMNPLIIYCRPPEATIFNWGDRPQMEGVIENGQALLKAYDESMDRMAPQFKIVKWDFTAYEYTWLLNQVVTHMEKPND